jgi:hypothetical protein
MSFRFSISDFITVDYMVVNIKRRLSDKSSDYQALLRGIDVLQKALQHVDGLHPIRPATEIDSIEYTALSCRESLEEFLKKVGEYKRSLGYSCQSNVILRVTDRLPLELGKKDDALEFDSRQPEVIVKYQVSSYSLSYFKSLRSQMGTFSPTQISPPASSMKNYNKNNAQGGMVSHTYHLELGNHIFSKRHGADYFALSCIAFAHQPWCMLLL